jgi:hypothetical protein
MLVLDCDGIDVILVPWPDAESTADELALAGRPRVLLVGADAEPPDVWDPLEDWVRVPAAHGDVEVRARRLGRIALARRASVGMVKRDGRSAVAHEPVRNPS